MKDLLWIPKMKNLVLSDLNIKFESDDEGNVPFYKTPMAKLKRLQLCDWACDLGSE